MNKNLKIALLAGVSFANAAHYAPFAWAQEAGDEAEVERTLEAVVVTGFRNSLAESRDLKRDAVNSRESILAEDIGKLPDLNLAEAIQRVPGVAISREGG